MHTKKEHIERRLKRRLGMTPERLNEVHAHNDAQPWRVKCWSCGHYNEGLKSDLTVCRQCASNLWKRT